MGIRQALEDEADRAIDEANAKIDLAERLRREAGEYKEAAADETPGDEEARGSGDAKP